MLSLHISTYILHKNICCFLQFPHNIFRSFHPLLIHSESSSTWLSSLLTHLSGFYILPVKSSTEFFSISIMMCFIPIYQIVSSTELLFLTFPISPPSSKNMLFQVSVMCIPLVSLCKSSKSIYKCGFIPPIMVWLHKCVGVLLMHWGGEWKEQKSKSCFVLLKKILGVYFKTYIILQPGFNHSLFLHPSPLSSSFYGCGTSLVLQPCPHFSPTLV